VFSHGLNGVFCVLPVRTQGREKDQSERKIGDFFGGEIGIVMKWGKWICFFLKIGNPSAPN
jgi:hypothetical protein